MENNVEVFEHGVFGLVEVVNYEGKPTFYANDVATLLGYSKPQDGRNHCKSLIKLNLGQCKTLGLKSNGNHGTYLIGIEDLRRMVTSCKLPDTTEISNWFSEIIPSYGDFNTIVIRDELVALKTIEQILDVKLVYQYPVLNYLIDGYDPINKIAYEIDEKHHKYQQCEDFERELRIRNYSGCEFVRVLV